MRETFFSPGDPALAASATNWPCAPMSPPIGPGEVHVWRARLDLAEERVRQLSSYLSADEQQRADRFHFPEHRQRFRAAHGILRDILGRCLGVPPAKVPIETDGKGKPRLAAMPTEPPMCFNLSHSGLMALIALTRQAEVGVDVELVRPLPDAMSIAERHFAPAEHALLRGLAADQGSEAFWRCWTRKEAFVKAVGEGLAFGLDRVEVAFLPGEAARIVRVDRDSDAAQRWWMADVSPAAGYVGACVVAQSACHVYRWDWQA
jgi:4'-phosphopantetheinyl transferase